jgi:hypothetical protein
MHKRFITFPSGQIIRADTIYAVNVGDAGVHGVAPNTFITYPRLIIHYGPQPSIDRYGSSSDYCIVIDFDSHEERYAMLLKIHSALVGPPKFAWPKLFTDTFNRVKRFFGR